MAKTRSNPKEYIDHHAHSIRVWRRYGSERPYYCWFRLNRRVYQRNTGEFERRAADRWARDTFDKLYRAAYAGDTGAARSVETTKKRREPCTLAQFKAAYRRLAPGTVNPTSINDNLSALTRLIAEGKKITHEKAGSLPLDALDGATVNAFICARQGLDQVTPFRRKPLSENTTINTTLRLARACFTPKIIDLEEFTLKLPDLTSFQKASRRLPEFSHEFKPLSHETVTAIQENSQKELHNGNRGIYLTIQLALHMGLRPCEIVAACRDWIESTDGEHHMHIKNRAATETVPAFYVKATNEGAVPVPSHLLTMLLTTDGYILPGRTKKERAQVITDTRTWLRKYIPRAERSKCLYELRKQCGSIILRKHGIAAAAKVLRNSVDVCMKHYASLIDRIAPVESSDIVGAGHEKAAG